MKPSFEVKFVFLNHIAKNLLKWLNLRCTADPDFPSSTVASIYFDTYDWRFLEEKINSDFLKTKVRIRWYNDLRGNQPGDVSFFEIKRKIGPQRNKIRIKTGYKGDWLEKIRLEDQSLIKIPSQFREPGVMIPDNLFPVFELRYQRWRFIEPFSRSRVCLDCNISTPRVNRVMLPNGNMSVLPQGVFEIKSGNRKLPHTLRQLTALGCRKSSFSKYSACYANINGSIK